ncbi:hypothetical protein DIPPA_11841 [Diplonema papillatum]|nr:hypothetical protein DIPPA_11841 [Diplonema papillatum]
MRAQVLVLAFISAAALEECTQEDIGSVFTDCYEQDGNEMTKAVDYWARECEPVGVSLSQPVTLNCSVNCPKGHFYSAKARGCDECPVGTFADPTTYTVSGWSKDLSPGMRTYCRRGGSNSECAGWVAEDGRLVSGNNIAFPSVKSTLAFHVDLAAEGRLTMEYKVECEYSSAGVYLYIDGEGEQLASGQTSWLTVTKPLQAGRHFLQVVYVKDNANQVGRDKASIKRISVDAQEQSIRQCEPCPAGLFSDEEGSSACKPCPANSFRDQDSTSHMCSACETGWVSSPGATSCIEAEACKFTSYGPCRKVDGGAGVGRTISSTIFGCAPSEAEAAKNDACAPCAQGFFRRENEPECVKCADGQYRDETGECQTCGAGYFATPKFLYPDFSAVEGLKIAGAFPDERVPVVNVCSGAACRETTNGENAFEFARYELNGERVGLSSGLGHGNYVTVNLTMSLKIVSRGSIQFKYLFVDLPPSCVSASFTIKSEHYPARNTWLSTDHTTAEGEFAGDTSLIAGRSYVLEWLFIKQCGNTDYPKSRMMITSLDIVGAAGGGALGCQPCDMGYECAAGTAAPAPCPAGTYQDFEGGDDNAVCKTCEDGKASIRPGATECEECPAGVKEGHTNCIPSCRWENANGTVIDLTAIGDTLFGPIINKQKVDYLQLDSDPTNETRNDEQAVERYYLKLCNIVNDDAEEDGRCVSDALAYACQRYTSTLGFSMGDWASYDMLPDAKGISVMFTGGEDCYFYSRDPFPRETRIDILCDPEATDAVPTLEFVSEMQCEYNFQMYTAHACPACTFVEQTSDCNRTTRLQTTTYHKNSALGLCAGEFPADKVVPCNPRCRDEDWEVGWSECSDEDKQTRQYVLKDGIVCAADSAGPSNAGSLAVETRSCVGARKMAIGVGITILGVLILIVMLVILYRKKNAAEARYSRLSHEQAEFGSELPPGVSTFDDDDEEEDRSD